MAWLVAVLATFTVVTTATLRATVLSPAFHAAVLDREHTYDRLYDEVLVDPVAAPVARDLLAGLPVPEAQVTSNIKLVLPPATVRDLTRQQIDAVVGYLAGERDRLRIAVDLAPVLAQLDDLAHTYFGDLVAGLQDRPEPDFARFSADLSTALRELSEGRAPAGLPTFPLTEAQAAQVADALLRTVPESRREQLRPETETALADGDVATALAVLAPAVVSDRTRAAGQELRLRVHGTTWDLTPALESAGDGLAPLHRLRPYTAAGLGLAELVAALALVGSLAALWLLTPARPGGRPARLGPPLLVGGALAALAFCVLRLATGGRIVDPPGSWPPSLARLVDDVQRGLLDRTTATGLWAALGPVLLGAGLVAAGPWLRSGGPVLRRPRSVPAALGTGGA
ncbi:hypothetical protein GTW43_27115, partial [Streptomyces sp. SID5785]|nr:hypothetical protein [Streptomyces sp. SID5785]